MCAWGPVALALTTKDGTNNLRNNLASAANGSEFHSLVKAVCESAKGGNRLCAIVGWHLISIHHDGPEAHFVSVLRALGVMRGSPRTRILRSDFFQRGTLIF